MSGNYQRQSLELRSPDHGSVDDPDGRLRNLSGSSASQLFTHIGSSAEGLGHSWTEGGCGPS